MHTRRNRLLTRAPVWNHQPDSDHEPDTFNITPETRHHHVSIHLPDGSPRRHAGLSESPSLMGRPWEARRHRSLACHDLRRWRPPLLEMSRQTTPVSPNRDALYYNSNGCSVERRVAGPAGMSLQSWVQTGRLALGGLLCIRPILSRIDRLPPPFHKSEIHEIESQPSHRKAQLREVKAGWC